MNLHRENRIKVPSILETERLTLRIPALEDALVLSDLAERDAAFARNTVGDESNSLENCCIAIIRMLNERSLGRGAWWVVEERDTGRMIGIVGFSRRHFTGALITALASDFIGMGYVREVVRALTSITSAYSLAALAGDKPTDGDGELEPAITARWYWHSKDESPEDPTRRCA